MLEINKAFIIAEVGQAHDGSLGILHSYIDALAKTGVNAIKFQTHVAEAESSAYEPFRVNFSYVDQTRMDYWKRMSFTDQQWMEIKSHCDLVGLEFISSPFSLTAVDLLENIGVQRYKIGSGEVSNYLMLDYIASTGKPIILSSGMSSYRELDQTIDRLDRLGVKLSLLQCTSKYPTSFDEIGINVISEMRERYHLPVGLSDHSGSVLPSVTAMSLGAELIEVHAVFDRQMFGPDSMSSLEINELKELCYARDMIFRMISSRKDKNQVEGLETMRSIFGKSLAVRKNLRKGHVIQQCDLESKKPSGRGVSAQEYERVVGKKLTRSLAKWDFITEEDFDD